MTQLEEAIAQLYLVFAKYSPTDMYYCTCGCINEKDVRKLASKPLHKLGYDELVSYQGSALYTWGGPEHYRHFLPRILELHGLRQDSIYIELREVFGTLTYAHWENWPLEEQNAIKNFVKEDWKNQVNHVEQPSHHFIWDEFECFLSFNELLELWEINDQGMGLKNFVYHFYDQGNAMMNTKPRHEALERRQAVIQFAQRNNIVEALEREFFKTEAQEPEYAECVSVVQQMIELELKVNSTS